MIMLSGQGSNIISVQVDGSFVGGTMTVAAINGCGASPVRIQAITRNVLSTPVAISGPANGDCSMNGVVFTATPVTGANTYLWTVPAGATIAGVQNGASITVDFGNFTSGVITVAAINGCGAGGLRSLTVQGKPSVPVQINGPGTLCAGATYTYDVPTVSGAASYSWLVPTRMSLLSGQGTKTISVKALATGINMTVNVSAVNACGTGSVKVLSGVSIVTCPRIEDGVNITNMYAYPNPVHDLLHVVFNSNKNDQYTVRMLNEMGQIVYSGFGTSNGGETKLDVSTGTLSAGIYVLDIQSGSDRTHTRIIVE
jgi:hypothetical protein